MVAFPFSLVSMMVIVCAIDSVATDGCVEENGMPVTDALKEKWGIIFDNADIDKDGLYAVDDVLAFAERLINNYNASGELAQGFRQYGVLYKDVIDAYCGADTPKTALTRSEYIKAHGWYWSHHYDMFKKRVRAAYAAVFHTIDSDNDGVINFGVLQESYNIYGDPGAIKKKAKGTFKMFDSDGDGFIEEDEFYDINLKYVLDPDITAEELPLF